ncbi:MAG: PAS domain-containing protein [Proteobacteria bacterium]|nr:PAS domain-containing protein [Pseudomonadota bacterium]
MMIKKNRPGKFWNEVPALVFVGSLLILTPIFAYTTIDNIRRQERNTEILLGEKGAALIRSFEAGTRIGITSGPDEIRQLQKLLYETAQQPDIEYLLVADTSGTIIAHSNYSYTGVMLNLFSQNKKIDLGKIADSKSLFKQIIVSPEGKRTFLVFRKFSPTGLPQTGSIISFFNNPISKKGIINFTSPEKVILVALDMSSVDEMRKIYFRDAITTGVILLLTGISGIIFLFMVQGYRTTRISLKRIKVFSNTLVEHMPVGLIALDSFHNIVSLNQVAKMTLTIDQESEGKAAQDVLPSEMNERILHLGNEQDIMDKEITCTMPDGRSLPLEISAAVLRDQENGISGTICLFKDLSEEKALKHEVERSHRLASVGKLAAGVAHEVRNPLSSIKGFATYFKERYKDIPEDQQISDIMIQEVDRLNRVVGQLLEFARPITLSLRSIPLEPFMEKSLKLVERKAQEAHIKTEWSISSGIDSCLMDPDRISQVLLNLYINAIDAMEHGGTLTVTVSKPMEKCFLLLQIRDTGIGIEEQDLEHIFDPYFTTKSSGTGLGLAISHNIIEAHGGEINIESKPGQGTVISITIPYKKETDEQ